MRKIVFAVLAFFIVTLAWAQAPKLAVLNPTLDASIDEGIGGAVIDKIAEELLSSRKFTVLDRAARDQIWEERNFQISSGEIKSDEIKEVGRGLGAEYIVATKVRKVGTLYAMVATLINVETLEVMAQASSESQATVESLLQLASYCGDLLAKRVSLSPSSGSSYTTTTTTTVRPPIDTATTDVSVSTTDVATSDDAMDIKASVRPLLKQKAFLNASGQRRISQMLGSLDVPERRSLYREFSKTGAAVSLLLNLIPLIPVGSFVQGDVSGAIWLAVGQGLCLLLGDVAAGEGLYETAGTFTGLWGLVYLYGWFQPLIYQAKWNRGLSRSLGVVAAIGPSDMDIKLTRSEDGRIQAGMEVALLQIQY